MHSINSFANSFVSIFIPIYLLTLGYSVTMTLFFLIVQHAMVVVGSLLAIYAANKVGLYRVLQLRFLFLGLYLLLLFWLQSGSVYFFAIAVIGGLNLSFYWTPVNILFTRSTKTETIGSSIGNFLAFPKIAQVFGPLFAGIIATYFGFSWLFVLAFFISIVGFLFITSLVSQPTSFTFSWAKIRQMHKENRQYFLAELFDNVAEEILYVLWPIFIFLTFVSLTKTGLVGSLIAFGAIAFTLLVGHFADTKMRSFLMRFGAGLMMALWFLIYFFQDQVWLLYSFSFVAPFVMALFLVNYHAFLFTQAKKDEVHFIVLREIPVVLGRILAFLFAALAIYFWKDWSLVFLLAGVAFTYFLFWFKPERETL